ncbi:MAG: SMP-30/gluconolactonase/LRE family protein [Deltaproteobacteria bacterium]|nr:SMP-30/gluconolactonase/LRE family protein [Deltaproteobacteria bacterium]
MLNIDRNVLAFASGFWFVVFACFFACSQDQSSETSLATDPTWATGCSVGQVTQCTCLSGQIGTRVCFPDGTFSECNCTAETPATDNLAGSTTASGASGINGIGGDSGIGGVDSSGGSSTNTQDAGGVVAETGGNTAGGGAAGGAVTPVDPPADCKNLPPLPITDFKQLTNVLGSEDFTFDNQGYLVGVTLDNKLFRVSYSGTSEILLQNAGTPGGSMGGMSMTVRGMRFLPDGHLVFADRGSGNLVKMSMSDYSKKTLMSGLVEPNGLSVDMKGFIYATEMGGRLFRVDPNTGASSVLFSMEGVSLDGIAFAPDYKTLYFNNEMGYISYIPVFDDGTSADYTLLTQIVPSFASGGPPMLDGLTVDECGNVYVVQMTGIIYRISPIDGTPQLVVTLSSSDTSENNTGFRGPPGGGLTINAVNFGSGINGWKEDAIYVISMMGSVYEVELGVKGIKQPHIL